jgi:hypothetical protein
LFDQCEVVAAWGSVRAGKGHGERTGTLKLKEKNGRGFEGPGRDEFKR